MGHRITGECTRQNSSRGIGWEYLHLAIDDHSRLAYSEIRPDEQRGSCLAFLFNALRFFRCHGIAVERVMTDNGLAFKSGSYAKALRRLTIRHKRTRPYTPKTNGKVERFVQTFLREWTYARAYDTPEQRGTARLPVPLQLEAPARRHQRQNTYQPNRLGRGQPVEAPHLAAVMNRPRVERPF